MMRARETATREPHKLENWVQLPGPLSSFPSLAMILGALLGALIVGVSDAVFGVWVWVR